MAYVATSTMDLPESPVENGEVVTRVGKSKSTGELKAYINNQWVPIKDATRTSDGKYYITRHPEVNLSGYTPTKEPSLLDSGLSVRDMLEGKKQVEQEVDSLPKDEGGFVFLRGAREAGAGLVEGTARLINEKKFKDKFGKIPEGYKVATDEEFVVNRKNNPIKDPSNPYYHLIKKEKDRGFIESSKEILGAIKNDPATFAKDLVKGMAEDPWMLGLPFAGRSRALSMAEKIASKAALGQRGTAALSAGAAASNAMLNIAGVSGAMEGAKQFGQGEFKPGEMGANIAMQSPFALLGVRLKDWQGMVKSGRPIKEVSVEAADWLKEQGINTTPDQVGQAISSFKASDFDPVSGALKRDIYGKEGNTTPRVPTKVEPNLQKESMGNEYAQDFERQLKLGRYAKEAEQVTGGEPTPVARDRAGPTPEELGQTTERVPVNNFPPEAPTPEQLGQLEPRVPEGTGYVAPEKTVTDPSTGMKMKADEYVVQPEEINYADVPLPQEKIEIPPVNASGESAVSAEALSALAQQKAQGISTVRINAKTGETTPLNGIEARDPKAYSDQIIADIKEDGSYQIRSTGENVGRDQIEGAMNRAKAYGGLGKKEGGAIDPELAKKMGIGAAAATGLLLGGDEPGERLYSAVGAGLAMTALTRIPGMRTRAATKAVDAVELKIAEGIAQGMDAATAAKSIPPEILERARKGSQFLKRKLELPQTKAEAEDIIQHYTSNRLQDSNTMKADYLLGMVSTRIGNESKPLLRQLRAYEQRIMEVPHKLMELTDPFKEIFVKLPNQEKVASDLFSGKFDDVRAQLDQVGRQEFDKVVGVIDSIGDSLIETGIIKQKRDNYWPRMVKDLPGLLETFGRREKLQIETLLDEANRKMLSNNYRPLNKVEEAIVIDNYLRGYLIKETKPGFAKERKIDVVTPEMLPFYEHPISGLHTYIHNAVVSTEKAKLFGKDIKFKNVNGIQAIDIEASVGGLLNALMESGEVSKGQLPILKTLLSARYGIGEKAPNVAIQHVRNLTSAALLGNFYSALRQGGDLGVAMVVNNWKPALESSVRQLLGKQEISAKEFGLVDRISEEFASDIWSGKVLNQVFRKTLFSKADIATKDIFLNSSLINARSPKGQIQLVNKYRDSMSPQELGQLISDINSKNNSPLVREYLWNELNDIQPLTKLETTQFGLENPNARIMYSLKSYMLKQGDWIRNNAYNQIKNGDTKQGLLNLTKYMMLMGATQTGVNAMADWAMGRDLDINAFDIPANVFKMFGLNEFNLKKLQDGKAVEVISNIALPPLKAWQDILDMDKKSLKYVPGMRPVYELGLGGAEDYAKKQEAEKKKEAKPKLSDVEKRMKELDKQLKELR